MTRDRITQAFIDAHGHESSYISATLWQKCYYFLVVVAILFATAYRWDVTLCITGGLLAIMYFAVIGFRAVVTFLSLLGFGQIRVKDRDITMMDHDELPIVTILVPLYKEANIAGKLIANLDRLDYPPDKLDVKVLLEADDSETQDAVSKMTLSDSYDVIIVPDGFPKTKPRACNWGLERAKGEFCVIYDAEDRPDRDQLMKVVYAFRQASDKVVCLQAKLNYYNSRQNILTRLFTIEYTTTFDLYLPGLQCMRMPIPLGGTSNHFRTSVLRELGGWDPFNVTEDCDLGVRIYKHGYRTRMIDSTTWEEANSEVWNWVRQRSRWVKGFFQTHLTHMRNPLKTLWQLNPWGFLGFLMCVGGSSLMMILNVVYWVVGGSYLYLVGRALADNYTLKEVLSGPREQLAENIVWPMVYQGPLQDPLWAGLSKVFFGVAIVLLFCNLLFVLMHALACVKRGFWRLLPWCLLMPFYWVLISIGAWKGFIQLLHNPFYWEKTIHGLDDGDDQAGLGEDVSGVRITRESQA
jgi:glycosyltransferase XagB